MLKKLTIAAAVVAALVIGGCGDKTPSPALEFFTDPRDGKVYRTVKIGNLTWMAENLNYQTDSSWCYDNDDENCVKYGGLYNWDAAMTACPIGWRLPSDGDWDSLMVAVGGSDVAGKKLKSKSGWDKNGNGTDDYGFSALPGSFRYPDGNFDNPGYCGYWWSSTKGGWSSAGTRRIYYNGDDVFMDGEDGTYAYSVRCVRE